MTTRPAVLLVSAGLIHQLDRYAYAKRLSKSKKSWTTACQAVGAEALRFHDLRRTAIRNMMRAGVSQHVAMRISGHQTASVFSRYDITSDDDLRQAAERTAAYTDQLPTTPTVRPLSESERTPRHPTPRAASERA